MNKLKNKVVIYPPTVPFNVLFQTPHQILKHLAKKGIECIFCNNSLQEDRTLEEIMPNFSVCYNYQWLKEYIEEEDKEVIFYYSHPNYWNPEFRPFNICFSIFHCLDNFSDMKENFEKACKNSNLLLCTSENLFKDIKQKYSNKAHLFRNAVDFDLFKFRDYTIPIDIKNNKSIIYYHGCLTPQWVDYKLIKHIAKELSDFNFVFIGLHQGEFINLLNIFYLGHKNIKELPIYLSYADVCILPFLKNEISNFADPVKIYEYFAQGKPVVSTSLPELKRFQDMIYFADTPEEFISQIKKALNADTQEKKYKRIQYAEENDWNNRVDTLIELIERRL